MEGGWGGLLTSTSGLKEEGVAIIPEEHSPFRQSVDGRDLTAETASSKRGSKRSQFLSGRQAAVSVITTT